MKIKLMFGKLKDILQQVVSSLPQVQACHHQEASLFAVNLS